MKHIIFFIVLFLSGCNTPVKKEVVNDKNVVLGQDNFITTIEKYPSDTLYEFCNKDVVLEQKLLQKIYNHINLNTDSLKILNPEEDKLLYKTSIDTINKETLKYYPSYYYFLLENKDDDVKQREFSKNYLLKKINSNFKHIKLILLFNKLEEYYPYSKEKSCIGYNIDILTYHTIEKRLIDRKRLITSGIGLEDISYHECFVINLNNIITYSYYSLEDEGTFIEREMVINENGEILMKKPLVKTF